MTATNAPSAPVEAPTDLALRRRLHDAWVRDALLEHASVASFARFTLELLAVGAPAAMVADAQRAGLDEIAHAQSCFALAARHAVDERPVGAGALDLSGLALRGTLAEVAAAAVEEACCGETFAAFALLRAISLCTDSSTRSELERIAADEARHAELGFRFVAWAVATGGAEARAAVNRAFLRARAEYAEARATAHSPHERAAWNGAGRLDEEQLAAVRREVWARVIEPAAHLLGLG